MADFSPADGAMISGIVVGAGYLLVFPFWMIRKLTRIEHRLNHLQSDIKEQDEVLHVLHLLPFSYPIGTVRLANIIIPKKIS